MSDGDSKNRSKEDLFWTVLNAAIELDFKKGHLKWSITDLSRQSGITRSLIYYYFGRSRLDIVLEAVKLLGAEVFGLTSQRLQMWQEGKIVEAIIESRKILIKSPAIAAFYATHRVRETEVGKELIRYEEEYFAKLKKFLPDKTSEQIEVIWAVMFGLTTTPGVHESSIRSRASNIQNFIIKDI